jgi:hypothetical protein
VGDGWIPLASVFHPIDDGLAGPGIVERTILVDDLAGIVFGLAEREALNDGVDFEHFFFLSGAGVFNSRHVVVRQLIMTIVVLDLHPWHVAKHLWK